jgi:rhodanese-related sulfurtransferase
MADQSYAGDLNPQDAWDLLQQEPNVCLIDVRTAPEWQYVGLPMLDDLQKQTLCVSWLDYPANEVNPDFVEQVKQGGVRPDQTVLLICRSGARSRSAAIALTEAGFGRCINVAEGFEGDKDADGHRGTVGGWKQAGLPWSQG